MADDGERGRRRSRSRDRSDDSTSYLSGSETSYMSDGRSRSRSRGGGGSSDGGGGRGRNGRPRTDGVDFRHEVDGKGNYYIQWLGRPPADSQLPAVSLGAYWSDHTGSKPGRKLRGDQWMFAFTPSFRSVRAEKFMWYTILFGILLGLCLSAAGFQLANAYLDKYASADPVNKPQANVFAAIRYFRYSLITVGVMVTVVIWAVELYLLNKRLGIWSKLENGGSDLQRKNFFAVLFYEVLIIYQFGAVIAWLCWMYNNAIDSPFVNPNRNEKLRQKCNIGTDSMCSQLQALAKLLIVLGFVLLIPLGGLGAALTLHPRTVRQRLKNKMEKRSEGLRSIADCREGDPCDGARGMSASSGSQMCPRQARHVLEVPFSDMDGEPKGVAVCDEHYRRWKAFLRVKENYQ